MSWENYDDVLRQLREHGLQVDELEIDTPKPKRCQVEGDRRREKKGWYWLTTTDLPLPDGSGDGQFIVGSYGVWSGTDNGKVKVAVTARQASMTAEQKKAIAQRHRENAKRAEAIRKAEAARAAARAQQVWARYVTEGHSPYLDRKGVQPHGVRFDPKGAGTIAIPMQDAQGRTHGLQIVRGQKRPGKLEKEYWPRGLDKRGKFYLIGSPGAVILLAEGFATAATLHEATGLSAAVAYDAGNLMPVAEALSSAYPRSRILVCADDDFLQKCKACGEATEVAQELCQHCGEPHGQKNPGREAAANAALAVAGAWVAPDFPADREGQKLTDFNDLYHFPAGGLSLVRDQVFAAIQREGWPTSGNGAAAAHTTGGRGNSEPRSARAWMSLDELVERFVPIDDGTGKYVFDLWNNRLVLRDQMKALLPPKAQWDDVKAHPTWTERGAYYLDEIGFDPAGTDPAVKLNTWQGWPMEPREGECSMMIDLIDYLCAAQENGEEIREWLLKWMAYPLQYPGAKMATAVVMHGPQGTGKSAVFQTLAKIYGDYATVLNQRGLEDKFNADWVDSKLFLLAEEVVARQEMWHVKNELKELITGEWVRVNTKHTAAYRQRNQINIAFLSNEAMPVPIEPDDRRHAVIWTPPEMSGDFYEGLFQELDNGGVEAFYHYLLNLDLTGFTRHTRPPMTEAKRQLMDVAKPSEDRFLEDWLQGDTEYPVRPCLTTDFYQAYLAWCRVYGVRFPREHPQLMAKVNKRPGWKVGPQHVYDSTWYDNKARKRMIVPAENDLPPEHQKPAHKTQAQWLTDQYIEFTRHLGGPNYD